MKPIASIMLAALSVAMSLARASDVDPALKRRILALQRDADQQMLNQSGEALYRPAKAAAWLDFATHELYEDDRTGVVPHAIAEAERLLAATTAEAALDTPLSRDAEKVRDDLWAKAAELKNHRRFGCAARELAQLDVQLVWAGHEKWESGWVHAKTAVEVAENLAYEAEMALKHGECLPKPARVPVAAPATAPAPAAVPSPSPATAVEQSSSVVKVTIGADALFPVNKSRIEDVGAAGRARLDAFVRDVLAWKSIDRIDIIGHTDRLGQPRYNDMLSAWRAGSIRKYLVERGLPADRLFATGRGPREPVKQCRGPDGFRTLVECLQPNRRVEIIVSGERE